MYVLYSTTRNLRGLYPYFVKSTSGTISWGNIKEAKFFKSAELVFDYLLENDDPIYNNDREFWIEWVNRVGDIKFHHPFNVPE